MYAPNLSSIGVGGRGWVIFQLYQPATLLKIRTPGCPPVFPGGRDKWSFYSEARREQGREGEITDRWENGRGFWGNWGFGENEWNVE